MDNHPQHMPLPESTSLADVVDAEYEAITELSAGTQLQSGCPARDRLMGLALSGGGIRSATFNLGVVQALAELRLLKEFDYLSTVSGGGYIGSWLSAWIARSRGDTLPSAPPTPATQAVRSGVEVVEAQLAAAADSEHEPKQLRFLREYSNYLTPKTGFFSTDTLAGVATYLRNFLLNLTVVAAGLAFILLIPRGVAAIAAGVGEMALLWGSLPTLIVAVFFIELNLASQLPYSALNRSRSIDEQPVCPWFVKRTAVLATIVLPLSISALCFGYWLLASGSREDSPRLLASMPIGWSVGIVIGATAIALAFWKIALVIAKVEKRPEDRPSWRWRLLGLFTGIGLGFLALALAQRLLLNLGANLQAGIWHATVLGLPSLFIVFGVATIFVIGTSGREFEEDSREWWSRLGGVLFAVAGVWAAISAIAIYTPWVVIKTIDWMKGLGIAWLLTTIAGVRAAMNPTTGQPGSGNVRNLLANATPGIFVIGLLVMLAYALHMLLGVAAGSRQAPGPIDLGNWHGYANYIRPWLGGYSLLVLALGIFAATLVFSWRIDINLFSFHMFYRNRLIRCYLGASNSQRRPHPFTGFDSNDTPRFMDLKQRPYHIVNTALNITQGERLAWQERKACSFMLSPLFCGYNIAGVNGDSVEAYQPTDAYTRRDRGCMGLGTALGISGAAASPNQGYHSSPAVAFLLTVFNVRLGWWMQNPRYPEVWREAGPSWGLGYLLAELMGATDEKSKYIYLSDGGHFDNLGLYELIKRRCRFIMVCDAGCDPRTQFEDLGNAIRKCAIDLGVSIDIDTRALQPGANSKAVFHCAVGTIHYKATPGRDGNCEYEACEGYLLYIKPSMTGNEPLDVLQYAAGNPTFPHEPTTDQWFTESQFESYRKLGRHIALTVFGHAGIAQPMQREAMFVHLKERWFPASAAVEASFSKHTERLARLHAQLRAEDQLRFLDAQIYPEWDRLMDGRTEVFPSSLELPKQAAEIRHGFYFCSNLLELMEAVYLDLNLENDADHPDNRGWLNLFKHWSWSSMLMATYAICCANYGGRFQRFCEARLGLSRGTVDIEEVPIPSDLERFVAEQEKKSRINFVEAGLIRERAAHLGRSSAGFNRLLILRLRVRDPAAESRSVLAFTCGFALAHDNAFVYFRVQDHLRRMGLAREGLMAAYSMGYSAIAPQAVADTPDDMRRFQALMNSVIRQASASCVADRT